MASRNSPWIIRSGSTASQIKAAPFFQLPLILLIAVFLLLLATSSLLSSNKPRASSSFSSLRRIISPPEHSFVKSLDNFLQKRSPRRASSGSSSFASDGDVSPDVTVPDEVVSNFDNAVWRREVTDLYADKSAVQNRLKVYVYDMPSKFTYELLWLFHDTYRETSNLTSNGSPVHRLIEQHSVDYWLWADLLAPESERLVKTVVRVFDQSEADIFYIPFFTTISFFLLEKPQRSLLYREALKWITSQPAWQRSGGRDHVLPVHHPWSFKSHRRFMKLAIWLLPDLDSTGNWYKPGEVSLEKDVVLPYVPNVEVCNSRCLAQNAVNRKTLIFFRGRTKRNAGGKIRSKLADILKDEPDVIITEGSAGDAGREAAQVGMRSSLFCLSPAGDTPSSARLFDAIVSGCIPVIVSDELELPFEGLLDYRKMVVFVSSTRAVQPGWLVNYLRNLSSSEVSGKQAKLAEFSRHFQYSHPAQPLGPEDMAWRMIAGKVTSIKLQTRRSQRVVEGSHSVCTCDCRNMNKTLPSYILF